MHDCDEIRQPKLLGNLAPLLQLASIIPELENTALMKRASLHIILEKRVCFTPSLAVLFILLIDRRVKW